jgi:hypothetical protein
MITTHSITPLPSRQRALMPLRNIRRTVAALRRDLTISHAPFIEPYLGTIADHEELILTTGRLDGMRSRRVSVSHQR